MQSIHSSTWLTSTVLFTSSQQIPASQFNWSNALDSHRDDNLPVSPACALSNRDDNNNKEWAHHPPEQPCLHLGCQNLWTIKIAIFKHNNKVYQSYRNSFSYVILSGPLENIRTTLTDENAHCFTFRSVEFLEICLKSVHHLDGNNYWKQDRGGIVFIGCCKILFLDPN